MKKDRTHDEAMIELFKEDPNYAIKLLNSILEDGDQGELLIALRQLSEAVGGIKAIAEETHLNPTQLYRTLSAKGNPTLNNFSGILRSLNLHLVVARNNPRSSNHA